MSCDNLVNPSSGLPMMDDNCVDIEGNPFGVDLFDDWSSSDDMLSTDSMWDTGVFDYD